MDTGASRRPRRGGSRRRTVVLLALVAVPALLVGCSGSGGPGATPKPAAVSTGKATPAPTPTVPPTPVPVEIPIPATCAEAYTPDLFAALQGTHPPLNDASMVDVTFSDIERLNNTIRAGDPLVCTWGVAGPVGIVTAVSRISEQQSVAARAAMQEGGFSCTEAGDAVSCVLQKEGEKGFTVGESHYLRGTIGLSTRWINASMDGYTEGMVAAIWG